MTRLWLLRLSLVGLTTVGLSAAACAQERDVDPQTLPPRERAFALHGPLGDRGPTGQEAASGCTWSRLQIPTAQGLRWVAHESCDPDMWR